MCVPMCNTHVCDPCVTTSTILIVAIWVDDLMIFTNNEKDKYYLKTELPKKIQMVDLGESKNVLGFKFTRDRKSKKLWISKESYLNQILDKFNMTNCHPASTPSAPGEKLKKPLSENEGPPRNWPYQVYVRSLLFASQVSRPDIAHAVSNLSRFNSNPAPEHWTAVKRILRYIRGTTSAKLEYNGMKPSPILGYCDADWANDVEDRRSTTGYIFMKCGPISWETKKQPTVALSTTLDLVIRRTWQSFLILIQYSTYQQAVVDDGKRVLKTVSN